MVQELFIRNPTAFPYVSASSIPIKSTDLLEIPPTKD